MRDCICARFDPPLSCDLVDKEDCVIEQNLLSPDQVDDARRRSEEAATKHLSEGVTRLLVEGRYRSGTKLDVFEAFTTGFGNRTVLLIGPHETVRATRRDIEVAVARVTEELRQKGWNVNVHRRPAGIFRSEKFELEVSR